MYGELIPVGGGDTVPLQKKKLVIGRRESCDIVLRFPNVSSNHCELELDSGYWYVRDLNSRNGVKVNGTRVQEKRLDPGDTFSVATHKYEIQYSPVDLGAVGVPPEDSQVQIFSKSLLERAGIGKKEVKRVVSDATAANAGDDKKRFDVLNDKPGQIKTTNKPV